MSLQLNTLTFTIPDTTNSSYNHSEVINFNGTSIVSSDVAIKAINLTYADGKNHETSDFTIVPSIDTPNGTNVSVNLSFKVTNGSQYMSGTVEVLVIADVK